MIEASRKQEYPARRQTDVQANVRSARQDTAAREYLRSVADRTNEIAIREMQDDMDWSDAIVECTIHQPLSRRPSGRSTRARAMSGPTTAVEG